MTRARPRQTQHTSLRSFTAHKCPVCSWHLNFLQVWRVKQLFKFANPERDFSMKKLALFSFIASTAALASAQEQARVLSAAPIVQEVAVPQQVCGNETVYTGPQTTGGGAVLGAIAGGAAGNAIGGGSGRAAATAIGLIGGALLGNQIEGNGRPAYQNVQRCGTEIYYENRTVGYTVVYEYAGRQYTTQTQNAPGRYIQVQVQPVDNRMPPHQTGRTYSTQPDPYYNQQQNAYGQRGLVVGTTPYPEMVYPPIYQQPPLYVNPAVSLELDYGRGGGGHHRYGR